MRTKSTLAVALRLALGAYVLSSRGFAPAEPPTIGPAGAGSEVLASPPAIPFRAIAVLSGKEEVPPRKTRSRGTAVFQLSDDGTQLHYKLVTGRINNVVASHIHLAPRGVNGPVVAVLAGPFPAGGGKSSGLLAEGIITADDLLGPLAGQPLSALVDAAIAGDTYVNVHTNDGVDPPNTGPGDFPGGEIRGQLVVYPPQS